MCPIYKIYRRRFSFAFCFSLSVCVSDGFISLSHTHTMFSHLNYYGVLSLVFHVMIINNVMEKKNSYQGGFGPLIPRPNTTYKCGKDGKSTNNCVFLDGSFQLTSFGVNRNEFQYNIKFQGITFEAGRVGSIILGNPGDITFNDCIIKVCYLCFVCCCLLCVVHPQGLRFGSAALVTINSWSTLATMTCCRERLVRQSTPCRGSMRSMIPSRLSAGRKRTRSPAAKTLR